MNRFLTSLGILGLVAALAGSASAQYFGYNAVMNPPTTPITFGATSSIVVTNGNNGYFPQPAIFSGNGGTDVVLANLEVQSGQPDSTPDTLPVTPYTIEVFITDRGPAGTGPDTVYAGPPLIFQGELKGTASKGSANITNKFTYTPVYSINLGGVDYVVTIGTYTAPEAPGSITKGAIGAHIMAVPEPGTLAMLGAGILPLLGMLRRRK